MAAVSLAAATAAALAPEARAAATPVAAQGSTPLLFPMLAKNEATISIPGVGTLKGLKLIAEGPAPSSGQTSDPPKDGRIKLRFHWDRTGASEGVRNALKPGRVFATLKVGEATLENVTVASVRAVPKAGGRTSAPMEEVTFLFARTR
jgi:hypothetical protein